MKHLDECSSVPEAFFEMARSSPQLTVYRQPIIDPRRDSSAAPRERRAATFANCVERVKSLSQFFRDCGVRKGDRVAIISQSRPEWMEADLAILSAGGVVVSVYPSLVAEEVGYILFDSGAKIVVAENQEQIDKLVRLMERECHMPATEERSQTTARVLIDRVICFESVEIPEAYRYVSAGVDRVVSFAEAAKTTIDPSKERHESIAREDVASLVYTSGTTGAPKGVIQTHGNHLANVRQARETQLFSDQSCLSVFLPLAHAFARLMAYIGFLTPAGLEFPAVVSTQSSKAEPDSVTRDIREGSADIIPGVPRIFEKMQSGVVAKSEKGGLASSVLKLTLWAAKEVYAAKKLSRAPTFMPRVVFSLTGGIRRKIQRQLFGSGFRFAISGGAKLQPATNEFFDTLEITVLEGYGLTETVVATNINRLDRRRIGTVGPALASDIEVRIAEDGEICFRGPNIALGYYNRPTATKQAWDDDGWFHTGDLGSLAEDGFLSVTGRKKELIVTSGGKKIPPDPIEQKLKGCKFVSQVMMFGDDKPYCIALICPNMNAVEIWAFQQGRKVNSDTLSDEVLRKEIWAYVEKVNQSLSSFESVKKITILPEEFSIDNGLLTPTMKVRRREVVKRYATEIEQTYERDSPY